MKTNRMLRVLSLLAFLLLLAPFYDSCNGERLLKKADATAEPVVDSTLAVIDNTGIDSTQIASVEIDTFNAPVETYEESFFDKAYEFVDDDESESAFEFAKLSIDSIYDFVTTTSKKNIIDFGLDAVFFNVKNFCFLLIVIVTLLISIFSFRNIKKVNKLSRLNFILLSITVICLFLEGLFESITQIKWGYYAFILVNSLIFCYSKNDIKIKSGIS